MFFDILIYRLIQKIEKKIKFNNFGCILWNKYIDGENIDKIINEMSLKVQNGRNML